MIPEHDSDFDYGDGPNMGTGVSEMIHSGSVYESLVESGVEKDRFRQRLVDDCSERERRREYEKVRASDVRSSVDILVVS